MTQRLTNFAPRGVAAGLLYKMPGDRIAPVSEVTAAYAAALRALFLDPAKTILAKQRHTALALQVTAETAAPGIEARGHIIHQDFMCDALVTTEPGVVVGVYTADCLPVLFADTEAKAVAAAHAGWRGLAAGILQNTVDMLRGAGVMPKRLRAYIGPAICAQCFTVGEEVCEAFVSAYGAAARACCLRGADGAARFDLTGMAREILSSEGVENVMVSPNCTACAPETYWSHRRHGLHRGNQLAVVALEEHHEALV